jgi:23S rRNA-intervening sequence protein
VGYKSFENLEVWKQSCRLAVRIYRELKDCHDFGLKDQMTRSAVSAPSNIAEGAEKDSKSKNIYVSSTLPRDPPLNSEPRFTSLRKSGFWKNPPPPNWFQN